jgi:hypothetical protein
MILVDCYALPAESADRRRNIDSRRRLHRTIGDVSGNDRAIAILDGE